MKQGLLIGGLYLQYIGFTLMEERIYFPLSIIALSYYHSLLTELQFSSLKVYYTGFI
jgi:hypothetical protein